MLYEVITDYPLYQAPPACSKAALPMRTWHIHNHCTIYQVLGGRSNAYLIATGKGNILFDTGKTHARKRRITSYNVCYTKLLRRLHPYF